MTLSKPVTSTDIEWIAVAIASALCVLTLFMDQSGYRNALLIEKYYQAPLSPVVDPRTSNVPSLYQQGMIAYGNEDWSFAVGLLGEVSRQHDEYDAAMYYLGHCHFIAGNPALAGLKFRETYDGNGEYAEDAQWFMILSSLASHRRLPYYERRQLTDIANDQTHYYQPLARDLLMELGGDD